MKYWHMALYTFIGIFLAWLAAEATGAVLTMAFFSVIKLISPDLALMVAGLVVPIIAFLGMSITILFFLVAFPIALFINFITYLFLGNVGKKSSPMARSLILAILLTLPMWIIVPPFGGLAAMFGIFIILAATGIGRK